MTDSKVRSLVFVPFENKIQNALYLNAMQSNVLENMMSTPPYLYQNFKPNNDEFKEGALSTPTLPAKNRSFDTVLIQGAKNMIENKYAIAIGALALKEDGTLSMCAHNKSGGHRLEKLLQDIGFQNTDSYSKHKARVAWGRHLTIHHPTLNQWYKDGGVQNILNGNYRSQPGIFGWNKIDKGSEILIKNLPSPDLQHQGKHKVFKGHGADFGCGYGYLTKELILRYKHIDSITCIDADHRAIDVCRLNIETLEGKITKHYKWLDLTKQSGLKNLDFIIMNPPFHEGKNTDLSIGKAFIENAAIALKKHGELWMVANNHLAYESILENKFSSVEKIYEGQGFKTFRAIR